MGKVEFRGMRRILDVLLLVLFPAARFPASGALVVVGGGGTGPEIVARRRSSSPAARTPSLPSCRNPRRCRTPATHRSRCGSRRARRKQRRFRFTEDGAAAKLRRATLIWMPGGDQNRFMKAIEGTGLADVIRERHRAGVTVGGTSAGAAVLAEAMFTGDADLKSITAGATVIAEGARRLARGAHRSALPRSASADNRLISAVLDRPRCRASASTRAPPRSSKDGIPRSPGQELGGHRRRPRRERGHAALRNACHRPRPETLGSQGRPDLQVEVTR